MEELEPRILYSADPVGAVASLANWSADAEVRQLDNAPGTNSTVQNNQALRRELLFVDSRVPDHERLIDDLRAQVDGGRDLRVVVIGADEDGVDVISRALVEESKAVDAVHIFSHGGAGELRLGDTRLDGDSLRQRQDQIQAWSLSLGAEADLLIYGCEVASTDQGKALVDQLALLTGADVAASDDLTGSIDLGGDWILEYHSGLIQTEVALSPYRQMDWQGILATYTVTNTANSGAGSLRQAILDANANPGADLIVFNIAGSGIHTIAPTSALPNITGQVTIDATTDDSFAANGNRPAIVLSGASAGSSSGLRLAAGSGGSEIRGLVIRDFGGDGIHITADSSGNLIAGNFIGRLNADGTAGPAGTGNNFEGIFVAGANNTIGGTSAADRNVISGNGQYGIRIQGTAATGNVVVGNLIGLNGSGTASLGNNWAGVGIGDAAKNNVIGGTDAAQRNLISGNGQAGIELWGAGTTGNRVQGNWIGLDINGALRGNTWSGVWLQSGASNNVVGGIAAGSGNVIAGQTAGDGIEVLGSSTRNNAFLGNSIYSNSEQGIDHSDDGVTANDPGDTDSGPNDLQNYPQLSSAVLAAGGATIAGTLNSNANTTYRIEFFANAAGVADATHGEGQRHLGFTTVTTNASGNASFSVSLSGVALALGERVSATATVDLGGGNFGSTSEFAANVVATTIYAGSSTSSGTTTASTSLSWSHTVAAGANRILVVSVGVNGDSTNISGVTYGGQALTRLGTASKGGGGGVKNELWYLVAPTVGTANVVVTTGASVSIVAGATTYYGVDQATPYGPAYAVGDSGNTITGPTVTSTVGELVVDSVVIRDRSILTAGAGQTAMWTRTASGAQNLHGGSSTEPGAASVPMTWTAGGTGSGAGDWAIVAAALRPAPVAPVVTVPSGLVTRGDTPLTLSGANAIMVADADSANLTVSLSISGGTASLATVAGLTFTIGDGTADEAMTFSGSIASLNAALNGLVFTPTAGFSGPAEIEVTANDGTQLAVGRTTVGGTTSAQYDKQQIGTRITFGSAGTVTGLNVYLQNLKANNGVWVGLYADNGSGAPGALLAQTSRNLAKGTGWYAFDIPDVSVAAGNYWIGIAPRKEGRFFYDTTGGATVISNYDPAAGLAPNWTGTTATNAWSVSAYASFSPTAGAGLSDEKVLTITVQTAPVLDASKSPVLGPVVEDAPAPVGAVGTLVSALVDLTDPSGGLDNVTDIDSDALLGIAVVGANTANGSWWYSIDDGSTWQALGAVSNTSARLLAADGATRLYFRPNADWSGTITDAITFRAWDQTSSSNGALASTAVNGGTTAYSVATDTAALTVSAVNDAPVLDLSGTFAFTPITEDEVANAGNTVAQIIASAGGDRITDPDALALEGIAVTGAASGNGTWQYSTNGGASWMAVDTVSDGQALLLRDIDRLRFVPNAQNGTTASIAFRAWDRTSGSAGTKVDATLNGGTTAFSTATASATIVVSDVNDAPELAGGSTLAYTENQDAAAVNTAITVADVDNATLASATVQITGNYASGEDVLGFANVGMGNIAGVWDADSGTLTLTSAGATATLAQWQAALRAVTYVNTSDSPSTAARTVSYTVSDGALTSNTVTSTVSVAAVNDAPTGSVTIGGTPTQGQTLSASDTLADADGLGAITYTWKADGADIGSGASFVLTQAEVGKLITVVASYTDGQGTNESVTSAAVGPVAPANVVLPPDPILPDPTPDPQPNPLPDLVPEKQDPPDSPPESQVPVDESPLVDEETAPAGGKDTSAQEAMGASVRYPPYSHRFTQVHVRSFGAQGDGDAYGFDPWKIGGAYQLPMNEFQLALQPLQATGPSGPADSAFITSAQSNLSGEQEQFDFTLRSEPAQVAALAFSAGLVAWALRAGGLIASLMATVPAWRNFDPMPVLYKDEEDANAFPEGPDAATPKNQDEDMEIVAISVQRRMP